jgi:UDP-N-acetylmuramoyl-tripeptide--D-alanyl-D-alanine ligase
MNIQSIHQLFLQCDSLSTDTRKIQPNSLFIAIKGERFDANTFAAEALGKGASYVIIDNKDYFIDSRTILVEDSLTTLQALSQFHRDHLKLPIIALTGSNGKTTTKELMHSVLSKKFDCKATVGNLNNHIGVPLTLLSFTNETQIGIVEMGANHQKEIEFLCKLATPDYGYITNFGKAHLEGFGGVEGVIKGKSEMYDYLAANDKMAFVNLDDPIQQSRTREIRSFTFGVNHDADVVIRAVTADPFVAISYEGQSIQSKLIGLYNANNVNAAIAVGRFFKIEDSEIKAAIEGYTPENNRSQLIQKGSNSIILDAYNANPSSMAAAIENFSQLQQPAKIAILGDMFELGKESLAEHKSVINLAANDPQSTYIFIGKDFFANQASNDHLKFFEAFETLQSYLKDNPINHASILIKGSRGMALERILELI